MEYDSRQTGGTGYLIEFPYSMGDLPCISDSFRRDGQGIHRLELIAILEAMDALLAYWKREGVDLTQASAVVIHTDRHSITDGGLYNPWQVARWRRSNWKKQDGNSVKHADLLDQIDKRRKKLAKAVNGRVEVVFVREKKNKQADKLSKKGKAEGTQGRKIIQTHQAKVAQRRFDGPEVKYKTLCSGDELDVRVYRKDPVSDDQWEVSAEICAGAREGFVVKFHVDSAQEQELHRQHRYRVMVEEVLKHNVRIYPNIEELLTDDQEATTD